MDLSIAPGDFVQARMQTPEGVAVTEFAVSSIEGETYAGSPLGTLTTAAGWEFELVRKGDPNLPTVLSDLAVLMVNDRTTLVRIIGPVAGAWQTQHGQRVNPADILAWEPWNDALHSVVAE